MKQEESAKEEEPKQVYQIDSSHAELPSVAVKDTHMDATGNVIMERNIVIKAHTIEQAYDCFLHVQENIKKPDDVKEDVKDSKDTRGIA